jgi:hypothetical protein
LAAMDPNRVPGKWASQCCKSLVASKSVDCFWNVDPTCDLFMYLSETLGSPEGVSWVPSNYALKMCQSVSGNRSKHPESNWQ